MLPRIFRNDDPVLALALPPESKGGITEIVKGLPRAVFAADDSLGWAYQFWQADEADRVNEEAKTSSKKIGADELPVVTQLFTEDYMVLFLLEATLGAWWAGKVLAADPALASGAQSEEDLREKTSPPGYRWTYLRFVREPRDGETHETATGPWRPAAGAFDGWPKAAKEITVLDPCMGSGHFLVFALPILAAFRRAEEGLDERAAVRAVLAENLFGLEIDPRCTQIAAFALALASWKHLGGPEPLPRLNLACSGLAIGLGKAEFLKLAEKIADAEGWTGKADLLGTDRTPLGATATVTHRGELLALYDLFERAPYLGSLIDPHQILEQTYGPLYASGIDRLGAVLERLLQAGEGTAEARETAVAAQGLAMAARLLARRYTLVATNVPYLGRGKQHSYLIQYADTHFSHCSSDLSTIFIARSLAFVEDGDSIAVVTPTNWYFIGAYKEFRQRLLAKNQLGFAVDLGPAAFDNMNWWASHTALTVVSRNSQGGASYGMRELPNKGAAAKSRAIVGGPVVPINASLSEANPDQRIVAGALDTGPLLSKHAQPFVGLQNGDTPRFILNYWELPKKTPLFEFFQLTAEERGIFQGRTGCLLWENGSGALSRSPGAFIKGTQAWTKAGVIIRQMDLVPSIYCGDMFDQSSTAIIPDDARILPALFAYVESTQYRRAVKAIDPGSKVTTATMAKVPFDLPHWQRVAADKYPRGLPKPYSNDPTQWLFDGHPRGSADPNVAPGSSTNALLVTPHGVRPGMAEHPLQVAVTRLLGYHWPRQTGSSFMDCSSVPEPDEADQSGLVGGDGIVPLPALAGEADAAKRLRGLIRAIWGPDYGEGTIRELLAAEGAKTTDLGTWLADEFFDGHCRLFQQTPFIWHVWDGVRGGFSALVNYHRLCEANGAGRRLLEKLRDSYLGEWIATQRDALADGEAGAEARLIAAEHLRGELTKIIEGDPPYDIFVRWKPLYRQPIGWEPDIDHGVRHNIRPFLTARPKNSGRRDGCILRVTPRVKKHAGADRGAEPHWKKEDFPWFWAEDDDVAEIDFAGGPQFKGRRYNDFHYTRAFKQRARDAKVAILKGVA
jgi:hypothetical protein